MTSGLTDCYFDGGHLGSPILNFWPVIFLKQKNTFLIDLTYEWLQLQAMSQPRSQGLSSYRPLGRARRDPGLVWSRVSQNLGHYNEIAEGRGALVGILSTLSLRECGIRCHQNILPTRRKTYPSSNNGNPSCCRLCGLVQLGTLHIVRICSWRQKNNCTPHARQPRLCGMEDLWVILPLSCVAAESFPFSGGAEIEQATLSQFSSRSRAFGKGKETEWIKTMPTLEVLRVVFE